MQQGPSTICDPPAGADLAGADARQAGFPDDWFRGLSVYQDVLAAGQVVRRGARDAALRWRLIEPHLPQTGVIVDVGSNFGWFAVQIARARPNCLVLSGEADERSARVQRRVLETYASAGDPTAERVVLLTRRLVPRLIGSLVGQGPPLAAALCLSVLHWMPEHRQFVRTLGQSCRRLFIEQPHPDERGAGDPSICAEMHPLPEYLRRVLPEHKLTLLGHTPCHRQPELTRPLWMVERTGAQVAAASVVGAPEFIPAAAAARCEPCWPPRSMWRRALSNAESQGDFVAMGERSADSGWGLRDGRLAYFGAGDSFADWQARRAVARIPEGELFTTAIRRRRAIRRRLGRLLGSVRRWKGAL